MVRTNLAKIDPGQNDPDKMMLATIRFSVGPTSIGQIRFSVGLNTSKKDGGNTKENPECALCHIILQAAMMLHTDRVNNPDR